MTYATITRDRPEPQNASIPATCQHFADAADRLAEQLQQREDELSNASGLEITVLQRRIRELKQRIALENKLLDECIINPPPPRRRPLVFVSNLTATVHTEIDNNRAPKLQDRQISVAMGFSPDHRVVNVAGLEIPLGGDRRAEQTFGAEGTFDPATGSLSLPIRFSLRNLGLPFGANDATVDFASPGLTTEGERPCGPYIHQAGSRLDPSTGQIVLVGTGIVSDNFLLNGTCVELTLNGVLMPSP